jgi:hypothetical protein
VPPALTLLTLAVLVISKLARGLTVTLAVVGLALLPTLVVNDPAGIVFVPLIFAVTTTDMEQLPAGGITEPAETVRELVPATAVTVDPPAQEVVGLGAGAFTIPAG